LAAIILGSCGENPFEPRGEGERIPLGQVIEDDVSGDTVRSYSFVANPQTEYAVWVQALQGVVELQVVDSSTQQVVAWLYADRQFPATTDDSTTFATPLGGVHLIRVRTYAGTSMPAQFRFRVSLLDVAPEVIPAAFSIGDTVVGETIEGAGDIDLFVTQGTPGREIVAVVEALTPATGDRLGLAILREPTAGVLGIGFAATGGPALRTTARIAIPEQGRLWFRFRAVSLIGTSRPFSGPYRFWTYAINRKPERLKTDTVGLAAVIGGEGIDRAGDVDEYFVTLAAGTDVSAFIQSALPFPLEIAPQSGPILTLVTDTGVADTSLYSASTGRFQVTESGTYVLRVTGSDVIADTGAYRFLLHPIDRRPETLPQSVAPGDTIEGESIDVPGDVDEFSFTGEAGEEYNAFVQAGEGYEHTRLQLEAVDADGTLLGRAFSVANDSSLLRQLTGRFSLRTSGSHRLTAMAEDSRSGRGAYRLFLYRVNRLPESRPATLAFGDSVLSESIDLPGDVDEFQVTVAESSGANLVVQLPDSVGETSILAQLVSGTTGELVTQAGVYRVGMGLGGRTSLGPGGYVLRVFDGPYGSGLRGRYRVWLYRFSLGPELVPDTLAIGDTVQEVLEPIGDADTYRFYGVRRQHLNMAIQGLAAPSTGGFMALITQVAAVISPTSAPGALTDRQTMRFELPATGWYNLSVSGASSPEQPSERGAYRFAVLPVGSSPESVGESLVPGDSVVTELIDEPGDWDEYTVTAAPGQDVTVILSSPVSWTNGAFPILLVLDSAAGDTLAWEVAQGTRAAGPFRVPPNGRVTIAVFEDRPLGRVCFDATCGGVFRYTGGYSFSVVAVDRGPESVPAAYVLGDTVRGEELAPLGDYDEFTLSATPGETLSLWFRLTANAEPVLNSLEVGMLTIEVVDVATGLPLVGSSLSWIESSPEFGTVGQFVVPATGNLLIRVRGSGGFGRDIGTAPYEFFVRRGP
jgi:hypothetical protein